MGMAYERGGTERAMTGPFTHAGSEATSSFAIYRLTIVLLVIAVLLGGGGANPPLFEAIIEVASIPVLGAVVLHFDRGRMRGLALAGIVLLACVAAIPIVQLVPLPASVWTALPGRGLAVEAARLGGFAGQAMPLSLDREATLRSAMALLPGAVMFVAGLHLAGDQRWRLAQTLLGLVTVSAVLGAVQVAAGDDPAMLLYSSQHVGYPIGLFANRNHQADMLLIGVALAAGLLAADEPARRSRLQPPLFYGLMTLFVVEVVTTSSRMGIMLLIPTLLFVFHSLIVRAVATLPGRGLRFALIVVPFGLLVLGGGVLERATRRFDRLHDSRFDFWPDVRWAIGQYFPAGSGMGTFDTVFRSAERLVMVSPHYVNHAHNDYLEVALEAGLPGLVALFGFFIWLAIAGYRGWRRAPGGSPDMLRRVAIVSIAVILLHSAVDYPLRQMSLDTIFALCCALLVARGEGRPPPRMPAAQRRSLRISPLVEA